MPKSTVVHPDEIRRPDRLDFRPIPVNRPAPDPGVVAGEIGADAVVRLLRDMHLIRHFENALDGVKRFGRFGDVEYWYKGPAHLAIGQEAAAVGQALSLSPSDHVFGSHRSHGEFIAKGLAAMEKMDDASLDSMMRGHADGRLTTLLEHNLGSVDTRTRGVQFLLYGLLAEIFGRSNGFNRGMGGSMHAFFPPFGIYPNNAIVGASAPIAAGAALYKRVQQEPGLVVANIGDAAAGCGPVWEAMNFSAMGQLHSLWPEDVAGGLPVVFFFMNNFYGMGGQTIGETMAFDRLARIGAGVNSDGLHSETIDGNNPLAVHRSMERATAIIREGRGPVLIDCQTYRQSGHSPSDASSYRSREELELWKSVDPISEYGRLLVDHGLIDGDDEQRLSGWARDRVVEALRLAHDPALTPPLRMEEFEGVVWADTSIDLALAPPGRVIAPLEESPRVQQIADRARSGLEGGEVLPPSRAVQFRDALFEAIAHHAVHDDRLIIYGEENRDWGGAFGVYRGLTEILPYHRLFNAPISEATIVSSAVGYALEGGRALVELMYADFMGRAGDEIFNQLAKWRSMSGGTVELPVVLRISVGNTYGAQHSQEWTALASHIPGLKVVFPATPYDAKGLMASALSGNDPVVFFESQALYGQTEIYQENGVPEHYYRVPIGVPKIVRIGRDVTILSVGGTLYRAMNAAEILAGDHGIEAEVIDARSLVPFEYELLVKSVEKTGRLLCTSDAVERGSILATLAANVQMEAFESLLAPVVIAGTPNTIVPPAEMVGQFFPSPERMVDVILRQLFGRS